MVMLTAASAIANSPLLPAGLVSRCRGRAGHYGSGPRRVCADRSVLRYDMRLVGLGARFSLERRKPFALVTGSSRMQSASVSFCFESNRALHAAGLGELLVLGFLTVKLTHVAEAKAKLV